MGKMPADKIYHHEDWQPTSLREFIRRFWMRDQPGQLPDFFDGYETDSDGVPRHMVAVEAYVNHGRWVVDCPGGCGNALVVSKDEPFYICHECGSRENEGRWYFVVFPVEKQAIEAELLKRLERDGYRAWSRNWYPVETLADLRTENEAMGVA